VLRGLPNVHLLGQRTHDELPAYCKGFDVGLVPYRIDDEVKFIDPLKLREYLSAGVPVVSTAMPEVAPYAHLCHVAHTPDGAVAAIERALGEGDPSARARRSAAMTGETWQGRVEAIARAIDAIERRKAEGEAATPLVERIAAYS
jgi:glycosyltransferase involved in cell wall biosynthesis